jgi:hypothetical protein
MGFFSSYCIPGLTYHTRCLEHVVNLGVVSVMTPITKMAAIENATAIWEYDPTLASNSVLGGSLDVIAAIRTLAIKVSHSLLFNISVLHVQTTDPIIWSTN